MVTGTFARYFWEDSVIVDTAEQKKLSMLEVNDGLMGKAEYREKFFGETPEEAAAKIAEIDAGAAPAADEDFFG